MAYRRVDSCEGTRRVDDLFLQFSRERSAILEALKKTPGALAAVLWGPDSPLAVDRDCLFNMGQLDRHSLFACAHCHSVKRLTDFVHGGVGVPFALECGTEAGKKIVVLEHPLEELRLRWDSVADRRVERLLASNPSLLKCGTPANTPSVRCLGGDSFTSRLLTAWIVEAHLRGLGLPHFQPHHTGFVCRQSGFLICDSPTLGGLETLAAFDPSSHSPTREESEKNAKPTPRASVREGDRLSVRTEAPVRKRLLLPSPSRQREEEPQAQEALLPKVEGEVHPWAAQGAALQLLVVLKALKSVHFVHGAPCARGLAFDTRPCSYLFDGVRVVSPLTLLLTEFSHSSATVGKTRVFPQDDVSDLYFSQSGFSPVIGQICDKAEGEGSECRLTFRITGDNKNLYNYIRHSGLPIYSGALDLYCFFFALMADRAFFAGAARSASLQRLWAALWANSREQKEVEKKLGVFHLSGKTPDPDDILECLRGLSLFCSAVDILWERVSAEGRK